MNFVITPDVNDRASASSVELVVVEETAVFPATAVELEDMALLVNTCPQATLPHLVASTLTAGPDLPVVDTPINKFNANFLQVLVESVAENHLCRAGECPHKVSYVQRIQLPDN